MLKVAPQDSKGGWLLEGQIHSQTLRFSVWSAASVQLFRSTGTLCWKLLDYDSFERSPPHVHVSLGWLFASLSSPLGSLYTLPASSSRNVWPVPGLHACQSCCPGPLLAQLSPALSRDTVAFRVYAGRPPPPLAHRRLISLPGFCSPPTPFLSGLFLGTKRLRVLLPAIPDALGAVLASEAEVPTTEGLFLYVAFREER